MDKFTDFYWIMILFASIVLKSEFKVKQENYSFMFI